MKEALGRRRLRVVGSSASDYRRRSVVHSDAVKPIGSLAVVVQNMYFAARAIGVGKLLPKGRELGRELHTMDAIRDASPRNIPRPVCEAVHAEVQKSDVHIDDIFEGRPDRGHGQFGQGAPKVGAVERTVGCEVIEDIEHVRAAHDMAKDGEAPVSEVETRIVRQINEPLRSRRVGDAFLAGHRNGAVDIAKGPPDFVLVGDYRHSINGFDGDVGRVALDHMIATRLDHKERFPAVDE